MNEWRWQALYLVRGFRSINYIPRMPAQRHLCTTHHLLICMGDGEVGDFWTESKICNELFNQLSNYCTMLRGLIWAWHGRVVAWPAEGCDKELMTFVSRWIENARPTGTKYRTSIFRSNQEKDSWHLNLNAEHVCSVIASGIIGLYV